MRAMGPPLKEYVRRKHGWSLSIMDTINWSAHGLALKRNKHRRSHLVKFLHDILPTTGLKNKFDGGKRTCPLCTSYQEDRDHILRCLHPDRDTWRSAFLNELTTYCQESQTYPPLQQLLISVLRSWLNGEDDPYPNSSQYPEDVRGLIRRQQRIGWRHLLQGRFAVDWGHLQSSYHERAFPSHQYSSEKWQVGLILKIWERWHQLWLSRNQELYGRDELTRKQSERVELHRQLNAVYSQRQMMEPSVQTLLLATPEAHDAYPMHVTKNWLLMNSATFSESVKRVKTRALRGVKSIRTYFGTFSGHTST